MNDFMEHLGSDLKELGNKVKGLVGKITGKPVATDGNSLITSAVNTNYEINLVPQVKMQMIKAQKVRNLVLFICILVSSIAVGAVVVLFGIKSGQDIALSGKDKKLEQMSTKLNEYGELNNLITIQNQLATIDEIDDQKTVVARVFGALGVMLPQGADSVKLSELNVNMANNLVRMEGQADARMDPLIDYRVLESFKKGVALTKYDYGEYVDVDGMTIPTHCISETDKEGNAYKTGESYYAWWDLTIDGCAGSQRGGATVEGAELYYSLNAEVESGIPGEDPIYQTVCDEEGKNCEQKLMDGAVEPENDGGEGDQEGDEGKSEIVPLRVKIWRTPQFTKWFESGRMLEDGKIQNVEHFNSQCYSYRGVSTGSTGVRWTSTNECMLAPEGLTVSESSNGRDESNNLVLKFSGSVTLVEEFFEFQNKHMIAIGPMGQNVTDSYIQIGNMFTRAATECAPDDTECLNNSGNRGDS